MATGHANNAFDPDGSGPIGGSSISQGLSNEEVMQAVRFLNESAPRMQRNERIIQQWTGVVVVALIALIVTVAALVISSVYNQVQEFNEASTKSSETLNRINEQLIRLENSVEGLQDKVNSNPTVQQ